MLSNYLKTLLNEVRGLRLRSSGLWPHVVLWLHPEDRGSMDLWKHWFATTSLYSVTTQNTWTWIFTAVKISDFAQSERRLERSGLDELSWHSSRRL